MPTTILKQNDPGAISLAVYALSRGGIVIAPTETCYGMLADASDRKAVEKIFRLKGRSRQKSISIFVLDGKMISGYAIINKTSKKLIKKYLPGPLTLILKKRKPFGLAKNLSPGKSIAIRMSSHPFIQQLLYNYRKPLTATSANISGRGEIYSGKGAAGIFGEDAEVVIDGGRLKKTPPTTIVDCSGMRRKVIRQGELKIRP